MWIQTANDMIWSVIEQRWRYFTSIRPKAVIFTQREHHTTATAITSHTPVSSSPPHWPDRYRH